jgi:hypothetical protein
MSSAFLGVYFDKLKIIPYSFDEIIEAVRRTYDRMKVF